jgi:hypothetical protein
MLGAPQSQQVAGFELLHAKSCPRSPNRIQIDRKSRTPSFRAHQPCHFGPERLESNASGEGLSEGLRKKIIRNLFQKGNFLQLGEMSGRLVPTERCRGLSLSGCCCSSTTVRDFLHRAMAYFGRPSALTMEEGYFVFAKDGRHVCFAGLFHFIRGGGHAAEAAETRVGQAKSLPMRDA